MFSEDFREEKRRIGCGDRSEMEASLRDVKVALKHPFLPLSLLEIGGGREEEKKVVSGGRDEVENALSLSGLL